MNSSSGLELRVRVGGERPLEPGRRVGLHERQHVARPREVGVEGLLREDDVPEQLVEVAVLLVDAADGRRDVLAGGRDEDQRVADVAVALADDRAAAGERRERRLAALEPLELVRPGDRGRIDAADGLLAVAHDLDLVAADRRADDDAWRLRSGLAGADRDRVPTALRGDHVARAELIAQRALVAREQALAEDGHERDEREPDHQRRRGRGGAARIADRVLLCEPAGHSAEPGGREADDVGERADESRCDHCEADEDAECAAGDAEDAHRGRDVRAERAVDEPEDRQRRHDEAEDRASSATAASRPCRLRAQPRSERSASPARPATPRRPA